MRALWLFPALLFISTPAFALSDRIIDYCLTTKDPKACIQDILAGQEQHQRDLQHHAYIQAMELARIQANGMAMFGAGAGMMQGVNQGFQNMQQPYVNTPQFSYPPQRR